MYIATSSFNPLLFLTGEISTVYFYGIFFRFLSPKGIIPVKQKIIVLDHYYIIVFSMFNAKSLITGP